MNACKLKVCGITRLEDGQESLSLGASYLGFITFNGSPRFIEPEEAIGLWKKMEADKAQTVAVDVSPDADRLSRLKESGFDFFQLHFPVDPKPELVFQWAEIVGPEKLWLAPRLSPNDEFPSELLPFAETFLVDAYAEDKFGGTGQTSDWKRFVECKNLYPDKTWVLAGGIGPRNLEEAIRRAGPHIVDVNSAVESSPGIKDSSRLSELRPFFGRG